MSQHWYLDKSGKGTFVFDFAPLENGNGNSNFLDRASSPIEKVASVTWETDWDSLSPQPVWSSSIINTGSQVQVNITAANLTAGTTYKIKCIPVTNSSPTQIEPKTAYLHVTDTN